MLTVPVRLAAIAFSIFASGLSFSNGKDMAGIAFLILLTVLLLDYFRSGTVWVAFRYVRKGEIEKAEQQLSHIKYYNKLRPAHKASYHIVKGYIALNKNELNAATDEFLEAIAIGPKHAQDKVMCYLNLTNIYIKQKKLGFARETLNEAKTLKVKGFEEEFKRFNRKLKK